MVSPCSSGRRSSRPAKRFSCRWLSPERSINRRWPRSGLASAHFEEARLMEPDKTAQANEPGENRDQLDLNAKVETEKVLEEPQPAGLGARLRQLIEQARQGEARPNIKRQQLK